MKRLLLALAATMALVPEAPAQNAITQEGSVLQNSPMMFRGNNRARQGAGVGGAPTGQIVNTGDAVVGGRCDYSAPNDASGGYYSLCIDAATGKIKFGGTKSPQIPLTFEINGSNYGFPGPGNGNVIGSDPSTMNEITSWNSATGTALRQGAAQLTDNKTAGITTDAAGLTAFSRSGYTASQILSWAFTATGCPAPCTGTTYDALRSVAHVPAGTTVNLTNGIGAYVISEVATNPATGFPTGNGLFATVVANATNAKVWGVNTLLTDTTTGAVSAGTGKSLNNEFDFNVTSPSTTVLGLQLAGSSLAQPASAYGVALQPLDAPLFGTVARWTAFLVSTEGSTNVFASVGAKQHTGTSIKSQDMNLNFKTSAGANANVVLTGSEAGGLEVLSANALARAVTITGGPGRFAVDDSGGFSINSRTVMLGAGAIFSVGSDENYTTQHFSNAAAATTINGSSIILNTLPASAGAGGLAVCVDTSGVLYKKASCP